MPLNSNKNILCVTLSAFALAGCNIVGGGAELSGPIRPAPQPMVSDVPVRIGSPYEIAGRTWTPVDQLDYDEVGYASWYGAELEGAPTANGEAFNPGGVTAAHRTLPLPSYVEVTRLDTGRTILVRINDRGPADPNRLIDLSAGAAEQLGITESGMVPVRVRRTNPLESERATLRAGMPVPPRLDTPDSLLEILRERAALLPVPAGYVPGIRPLGGGLPPVAEPGGVPSGPGPWVVQVGAYSSRASAEAIARRIGAQVVSGGPVYRVRYGPFTDVAEAQAAVAQARRAGQPGAVILRAE